MVPVAGEKTMFALALLAMSPNFDCKISCAVVDSVFGKLNESLYAPANLLAPPKMAIRMMTQAPIAIHGLLTANREIGPM